MSLKYLNTTLVILVVIFSTALLVVQRFDGGKHAVGIVGDQEFRRGEVVHAEKVELLKFGGVDIWMDSNTDVKLVDGREENITINVVQGRVVAIGQLTIETRDLKTVIDGTTSFVHYSWEDRIEIAAVAGAAYLERNGEQIDLTGRAISTSTLPPYVDEDITFDPENSSAAEFYDSAFSEL